MRTIYYQAIFNGYDKPNVKAFAVVKEYVLITGTSKDPRMANRACKIAQPPEFGDATVYLDGNIHPTKDLPNDWAKLALNGKDMAIPVHPHRRCAYVEIEACLHRKKITEEQANQVHDILKREGLPRDFGLWECGIMVRSSKPVSVPELQVRWFNYVKIVPRDQLWLPLALYKMGKFAPRIETLPMAIRNNDYFKFTQRV